MTRNLLALVALLLWCSNGGAGLSPDSLWRDVDRATIPKSGIIYTRPSVSRTVVLDQGRLTSILQLASSEKNGGNGVVMYLPTPDGHFEAFEIFHSPVMHRQLARKYPDIRTYAGQGIDDSTAWVRMDLTPLGFHAMWRSSRGTAYIDPYQLVKGRAAGPEYVSYYRHDYRRPDGFRCEIDKLEVQPASPVSAVSTMGRVPSGPTLRTYRTAIAATGEYTSFHGGTVAAGLAAVVTAVNRVTGIYQSEVAVRLELIANSDFLIFTNAATDGYSNFDGFAMLGQNQARLDSTIGSNNYDIGHVFSTGGGGIAGLGVACRAGNKARGVSGSGSPIGDPFSVDIVAHEMGHQFGANHSFNGTAGSCGGGNRAESFAYEPGSGSTIMSYAGICGEHNIATAHDDYFHTASFDEIVSYTNFSFGNNCATITVTGNQPPTVEAGSGFRLPISTPLRLVGSASDPDGQPLVYRWEQFDLGPGGSPLAPIDNAPLFRSFPAVSSPERLLPKLADILAGTETIGEKLPDYQRTLRFRLTALDQQLGGGGVEYDEVEHIVTDLAGPFLITSQNTATEWTATTSEIITWDVANTAASPVNCANVDIQLSLDQGQNFDQAIALATPNDGTHNFVVPDVQTSTGRIQVQCSDSIFMDINNADITIMENQSVDTDADGLADESDNCTLVANAQQRDTDGDNIGNACDGDFDQNCTVDLADLAVMRKNFLISGDLVTDLNGDDVTNLADLAIMRTLFLAPTGPSGLPNACGNQGVKSVHYAFFQRKGAPL